MTAPLTIDELLAQLNEEKVIGWHGVSKPHPIDQLPIDPERMRSILNHPSVSE